MELLAFTISVVLSVGLGLAAAKLALSVLFVCMTRHVDPNGPLTGNAPRFDRAYL